MFSLIFFQHIWKYYNTRKCFVRTTKEFYNRCPNRFLSTNTTVSGYVDHSNICINNTSRQSSQINIYICIYICIFTLYDNNQLLLLAERRYQYRFKKIAPIDRTIVRIVRWKSKFYYFFYRRRLSAVSVDFYKMPYMHDKQCPHSSHSDISYLENLLINVDF
jgi:hypothetical protein